MKVGIHSVDVHHICLRQDSDYGQREKSISVLISCFRLAGTDIGSFIASQWPYESPEKILHNVGKRSTAKTL